MAKAQSRYHARVKRHRRLRSKVAGTSARPRLSVFRSSGHIYAQLVDDQSGHTLVSAATNERELRSKVVSQGPMARARVIGEVLAIRAQEKGVTQAVFDRGGYQFHGRVKALAEGSRAQGLKF
jgi:large subunit ribosomal protein L18